MAANDFERIVRDAMTREGLSLSRLALDSGIERGRWYAWFNGVNAPQPRSLRKAAGILGLTVDDMTAPWGTLPHTGSSATGDTYAGLPALLDRLDRQADLITTLVTQNAALMRAAGLSLRVPVEPEDLGAEADALLAEDERQARRP